MKNYPFIITVLIVLFLFSSCQKQPTKTVISGTIVGADVSFVSYSPPIEGLCFAGFVDMVSVNSSGEFIIVIDNMKDASFCFIKIPEISFYHYFIVEPEGSVQLLITNSEESVRVDMEGMNAKGLECYMQAERKSMELISNRLGEVGISNLPDTILALKEAELIPYKELYARSLISHSFYKLVSAQIECLYGAAHSLTLYKK
ncbi:MAG: hypothetical protein LIP01_05040 [Tannerellaceae bacterium]|nr:hypothetical protein [Tannerellaceae bacterium]